MHHMHYTVHLPPPPDTVSEAAAAPAHGGLHARGESEPMLLRDEFDGSADAAAFGPRNRQGELMWGFTLG